MGSRAFEDFTESEIIDLVERFAAANGFEYADGKAGEWTSSRSGGLQCRMKEAGDEQTKDGPKHSATAYLHLDAPQNCVIYSHRRGKFTWKIEDEQRQRPELFKNDASFAGGYHKPSPEEEEKRAKEREAKRAADAEAAEREFQANSAAAWNVYQNQACFIAPYGASGAGMDYLKSKGVTAAPGVKLCWNEAKPFPPNHLIVPFFDVLSGDFVTFQRIKPGAKGYVKGGFGGHAAAFWIVPSTAQEWTPETFDAAPPPIGAPLVMLCEGYATGATCAALFGLPVGILGGCNTMDTVTAAILSAPAWKRTRLIIAADDDTAKTNEFKKAAGIPIADKHLKIPPKNSGLEAARKAFNLDPSRVFPAPPPWKWYDANNPGKSADSQEVDAARADPKHPPSDWNDFAAIYPGSAAAAAQEAKAAAVEYFKSKQ